NATANLTVTDADQASAASVTANVKSTTDTTGFSVTLNATPAGSGVFKGSITFNATQSIPPTPQTTGQLKGAPGGTLPLTPSAASTDRFTSGAIPPATAFMSVDTATASLDKAVYNAGDIGTLSVKDIDQTGNGPLSV